MWYFTSGQDVPLRTFGFPRTKEDIEQHLLDSMLCASKKSGLNPYHLVGIPDKNPENDFDFTLPTVAGDEYLDLMEVAPLDVYRCTHETAPTSYVNGKFADVIMDKVLAKSSGYGRSPKSAIHLLLYSTDWKFNLTVGLTDLLAFQCRRGSADHCFKTIFYYYALDDNEGRVIPVFPRPPEDFIHFDAPRARLTKTFLGGPANMKVSDDGMEVSFTLDSSKRSGID